MIISGNWKIKSLYDRDAEGFERMALATSCMDSGEEAVLMLPPFMRAAQCTIKIGTKVFGFADTTTGFGVALFSAEADYDYTQRGNLMLEKTLSVKGNTTISEGSLSIQSGEIACAGNIRSNGDVAAGVITLKTHGHVATTEGAPTGPSIPL